MWTPSNAAAFQMTYSAVVTKGHHLEERVSHETFSRGKLRHYFFIQKALVSSVREGDDYITLRSIRGRHEPHQPTVYIWWYHYDSWNQIRSTLCSVIEQYALNSYERAGNGLEYNNKHCWSIKLHHNFITAHSWACSFRFKSQLRFPSMTRASAIQDCIGQMSSSISA